MDRIQYNNELHIGSKASAQAINNYFKQKISNFITKIPVSRINPMINYTKKTKTPERLLNFRPITHDDISKIIKSLRNSNACSIDKVSNKMIKLAIKSIAPLLLVLVNRSILENKFPDNIKCSKILPQWKKREDLTNPEFLRPINIMSSLSKIIEKAILQQLVQYLIDNNLVPQTQQGGMKGRSSILTILTIYDKLVKTMNSNKPGALVTSDQSAAYDLINHKLLEKKN